MEREKHSHKEEWKASFTAPDARILIVDDNRVNLKMAEGLLRPYRMRVETADSGEKAVEMVSDGAYHLVFMDYIMPGINGVEAAKRIRGMEEDARQRTVIVALSADADQGIREMFLEAGMDDYLPKPVKRCNLDELLRRWLPENILVSSVNASENKAGVCEDAELSDWQMDGIDVMVGMSYSDNDRALYLEVLTDFADSIEEKANRIECAVKESDLTAYTVGVHSLKSAARYLGAMTVADIAQVLEASAKNGDWEGIRRETPRLLSSYRKLYQSIAPYRIDRSYAGQKKELDREVVILLDKLSACMEDYDVDGGEDVIRALEKYDFGKTWSGHMDRILEAVGQFDYAACKEEALSLKKALEKES